MFFNILIIIIFKVYFLTFVVSKPKNTVKCIIKIKIYLYMLHCYVLKNYKTILHVDIM